MSEHFSLAELTASDTATRLHIDNTPDEEELRYLERLCLEILEPLREKVGPIRVTSGYRCIALNRAIGSKDTSHHVQGRAADIKANGITPLGLCLLIVSLGLPFEQVISEHGPTGWCHVSIPKDGDKPLRQTLTIDAHGTRLGLF